MYVHTRERDSRPGFDGVKIKLLLLLLFLPPPHNPSILPPFISLFSVQSQHL